SGGHLPKGGYDVHNGGNEKPTASSAVQRMNSNSRRSNRRRPIDRRTHGSDDRRTRGAGAAPQSAADRAAHPTPLSRRERSLVMVATTFGLIATLGLVAEKSIEPAIRHYVLLLCNLPGLLLAIIPFALLGGFSTAHGGSALLPSIVVLIVGNPIGFGVLAYLLISLQHQVIPRQE